MRALDRDRNDRDIANEPQRINPAATVVLLVQLKDKDPTIAQQDALIDEQKKLVSRRDRIAAGNPYRLDREARLSLPFMPPIPLGGLTDKQATQLLNADPQLQGLTFTVTLLPIGAVGTEALQPFGYRLFAKPAGFATPKDVPLPVNYVVGVGDSVNIDLFGKKSARYRLKVDRNGAISIPDFGPLQVSGLRFEELRDEVEQRVTDQMIGVRASVTMGQLRSIRVFVVGDVVRPGAYTVTGTSTVTNALFESEGVSPVGSLRNIEVKRGGSTVARFDLYDLLLKGDTTRDVQLQQGDAIYVAPLGATVGIAGQVQRPAIYEIRSGNSVGELLRLAGGATPDADRRAARLERIDELSQRVVLDLDLSTPQANALPLRAGDIVSIPKVLDDLAGGVRLEGHVTRPGPYAWRRGMHLSDLLGSLDALKVNADQRYVLIRREAMPERRVQILSADAVAALSARGSKSDPMLEPRDRVIIFSMQADRGMALAEVLQEVKLQVRDNRPVPTTWIYGRVRAPGEYPFESGMSVRDLVRAGGGFDEAAYVLKAELTRYEIVNNESRKTEVIDIDLTKLTASGGGDIALQPNDVLAIKEVPEWREQESITVKGEVRFPGTYRIRKSETLSSIIERAGGLSEASFPEGTVFMREEIRLQEQEQVETLSRRLQSDLTLLALQNAQTKDQDATSTLAAGQSLLQQLRNTQPKGRLVIDLKRAIARRGSEDDLQARDGDVLMIPRVKQYVTLIGEVESPTSHVWKSDYARGDYISMSGGLTQRADKKRIYIVRANGSILPSTGRSSWYSDSADGILKPGDTVVVPIDTERMRALPLWTAVSTIIYNLAIAVAAVNSF